VAFKILQAAERYNFSIVEDDIFCDLQVKTTPRLATLDQLNRVIYARSFSKTLSGSLRVGFIACRQNIANELADIKMLTSITTSQFTERLVYLMLVDGHYRKYLSRLHERLGEARLNVMRAFERIGLELYVQSKDGMFVWARFPHIDDSLGLAEDSQRDGIMLAPGAIFRPHLAIKKVNCNVSTKFHMQKCINSREKHHAHKTVIKLSHKVTLRDWHRSPPGREEISCAARRLA